MNPFDFTGPAFLIFYICLSIAVIVSVSALRRMAESAPTPRIDLSDPLLIAFLRGGHSEAMRVAAVSLIERGLLICSGKHLQAARHARSEPVTKPIEKALLERFASSREASSMYKDRNLQTALDPYEQTLKNVGLLPDTTIMQIRTLILGVAIVILGGVGLAKLLIAIDRGRPNVCFLIILIFAAIWIASKQAFPRLTESGKSMLEAVRSLYSGLRDRKSSLNLDGASGDSLMVAAVFGVGALSGGGFDYTKQLFPRAQQPSSSCSGGCGSSCGSSGGSSCGGGGGCGGGGCGGCGGS